MRCDMEPEADGYPDKGPGEFGYPRASAESQKALSQVSDKVFLTATGTRWALMETKLPLDKNEEREITEEVVSAAAGAVEMPKIYEYILSLSSPASHVDDFFGIASVSGTETLELLLKRAPIPITDGILEAAAGSWVGKDDIVSLLRRQPDLQISNSVCKAAAENPYYSEEILDVLDSWTKQGTITSYSSE